MSLRLIGILLVCLLCLPGSSRADEILPVAEGRYSVVVVLDGRTPRPATGAWVEFIGQDDNGVPRGIGATGFVLGTRENVAFVELSEREAEVLALARQTQNVRFQKIADPDPEAVTERQRFRAAGQRVTLAPRHRTITVPVSVSGEVVDNWTPGEVLTFPELGEVRWRPSVTGRRARGLDIEAMFISAKQTGPDRFDVTLVAEPRDAFSLLKAAAQDRLSVDPQGEVMPEAEAERQCYIRHRRGTETQRIEIPCE